MLGVVPSFADIEIVPDDPAAAAFTRWTVSGPDGGDVRVVTIDPKDKDRLYISTLDGQIFTSANAGKTWRLLANLNEPQLILDNLMVDSVDSKIIYASGHRHKAPGGFFRSIDGGATWKESKELHKASVHSLAQSPTDPSILVAGTTDGAWMSRDKGANWKKISSPTMPVNIDSLAIDPRSADTIYAGTWWRAYKTTDAGANWKLIRDGMIDDSDVFAITINPRNPEYIVASACSGIYESQNGGERWQKINGIPSQSRRTRDIVQHPSREGTIYAATTEGFWMSVNGGKSWSLTTQRNLEINSIAVHPDAPDRVFIATNNYGVMVSNDGGRNFTQTNGDLTTRFTYAVVPDRERADRLYAATRNTATGGGFFFISENGGATWRPSASIDVNRTAPFAILQDRVNGNVMYMGTNGGILRSMDRGVTWNPLPAAKIATAKPAAKPSRSRTRSKKAVKPAAPAPTAKGPVMVASLKSNVKVLAFTEDGKNGIIAGTDSGLYRSYDVTKGWEKLDLGAGINQNIFAIHVAPERPETIWVGTATSGVMVSRDNGKTFANAGGAVAGVPVSAIETDPTRPDYIYVGTTQTFYLSRDNGATWKRRGGHLPLGNFASILIDPKDPNEIIIGSAIETDGGIYISRDAGEQWKRIDTKTMDLPSRRVWSMAFDPHDPNRIYAGTHSSGVYKIELKDADAGSSAAENQPPAKVQAVPERPVASKEPVAAPKPAKLTVGERPRILPGQ
ncbi:MAG: BNR/Asp-box repeat domain/two component regulator propeller [Acidobacteria bacterium OLB17]|nr:MAG: BNR/Asp-box repeat domain/two component regulator propeller [Acidobacteria bacterium OLB17]MCZ2391830.1 hypothetical protein [Acidobacteriota bacterium]